MADETLPPETPVMGEVTGSEDGPIYAPAPGERQLTLRAVLIGCGLGTLVAAMNISFGLKTGWGIGGSLIAAILSYAAFAVWRPLKPFTPLETNIAQTSGSAAGTMTMTAGLVACIPALQLLGYDLGYLELTLWAASVAWLGVFFAVPLRRQMILVEKLKFPTGTATAHTIVAMFGSGAETLRKARALILWAVVAGLFTIGVHFVPQLQSPPIEAWFPVAAVTVPVSYTFTLFVSPLLIGAGILVGMRVSVSLMLGAVVAWGALAPLVSDWGWVEEPAKLTSWDTGARGWILWPGVGIMLGDALMSLGLSWRTVARTFRRTSGGDKTPLEDPREAIPNRGWTLGLAAATVAAAAGMYALFDVSPLLTLLAVALSAVLAAIATRSTGETDINPVSGVAKVTQLVYGGVAPGQTGTNLLAAGVTGSGASQAADMMQDLKTGHLLGASPRKQLVAQLAGIAAGILICVPIYLLVTTAYPLGSDQVPAPSAYAWKATSELVVKGFGAMPTHAPWALVAGFVFGVAVPFVRKVVPSAKPFLPSAFAFGIAFLIPAFYSIPFLVGAIVYAIWKAMNRSQAEALMFAVASGLIAGDGLAGIVNAALTLLKVPALT